MIEESQYCNDVMKKHFNKKLVMTNQDDKGFINSTKFWIYDNVDVQDDVNVRDHCYITGKYEDSAHRDFNIKTKLNQKILLAFSNLKNHDSHRIMQKLSKFDFKINMWIGKI